VFYITNISYYFDNKSQEADLEVRQTTAWERKQ